MKKLFVISDIHGHYKQFEQLLTVWNKREILVILGDLIDRGPQSLKVIQKVMTLKSEFGEQVVFCKGNHEDMLLDYLNNPEENGERFLKNGGIETMQNLLNQLPDEVKLMNPIEQLQAIKEKFMEELSFLENGKHFELIGNVLLTHAGFDSNFATIDQTEAKDFLWIRKHYLKENRTPHVNVFGHTPLQYIHESCDIWISEDRKYIGIDGGCYMSGQLNGLHISETGEVLNSYKVISEQ